MQNPDIRTKNIQAKFDAFGWRDDKAALTAWQTGMTGFPIVDAGMRELYQTGYMHNRVRMIVGSFLVKNLLLDWRHGERWFWDCLFDADFANNRAGWQWIAGCGADAAPYFRVFNPVTQGQKFDADGHYTRTYVPELNKLPSKYLFAPWDAPNTVLQDAGVTLGRTYPQPFVDLKASRQRALDAFAALKPTADTALEEQI
jgi:deoxyribodipyrimidine photo-lyase